MNIQIRGMKHGRVKVKTERTGISIKKRERIKGGATEIIQDKVVKSFSTLSLLEYVYQSK